MPAALGGTRIADHTPCSHWQTHTVVAALRITEMSATAVFDGPIVAKARIQPKAKPPTRGILPTLLPIVMAKANNQPKAKRARGKIN